MKSRDQITVLIAAFFLVGVQGLRADGVTLPRITPEAQGIFSETICEFVHAANQTSKASASPFTEQAHVFRRPTAPPSTESKDSNDRQSAKSEVAAMYFCF
jgi:hypothetical protein